MHQIVIVTPNPWVIDDLSFIFYWRENTFRCVHALLMSMPRYQRCDSKWLEGGVWWVVRRVSMR